MHKLVKAYLWFEKFVPGLLFVSIFLIMLLEIISRGLFAKSFAWSTEYCRYALVWVTFLGAVYVRREGSHIQVVFLHEYLQRNRHRKLLFAVNLIRHLVALAFWLFLAVYGYRLSERTVKFLSSAMALSQYWLYISTSVCGVFAGAMEAINLVRLFIPGGRPPAGAAPKGAGEGGS